MFERGRVSILNQLNVLTILRVTIVKFGSPSFYILWYLHIHTDKHSADDWLMLILHFTIYRQLYVSTISNIDTDSCEFIPYATLQSESINRNRKWNRNKLLQLIASTCHGKYRKETDLIGLVHNQVKLAISESESVSGKEQQRKERERKKKRQTMRQRTSPIHLPPHKFHSVIVKF